LRHEIGMLAETITRSLDLDDDGVMEEAIEECGGDNWVAEDLTPFGKAAVGGEDHGGALVAGIDELEEQIAAARNDRQISDFIHDQERGPAKESDALAQLPFPFGFGESTDDIGKACEVDATAGLYGLYTERSGEVALAGSGWAEEVDHLVAVDEVELSKGENAVAVERRLEREVEAGEGLDGRELGHTKRHLDASVLAQRQFLGEQGIDHFERTGFATLELAHGLIKNFQS